MFGRKAREILELKAALATNKVTIRMQDETIAKYTAQAGLAVERAAEIEKMKEALTAAEEVSHAKDGRLIELQGQVAQQASVIVQQAQMLKALQESYDNLEQEIEKTRNKLSDAESQLTVAQEELGAERQRAQSAARARSFGSLDEVNNFPGRPSDDEPEIKADRRDTGRLIVGARFED